jgi:acyl-CoA hydrolase
MPPSTVNAGDVSNVISGLAGVTVNIRVIHFVADEVGLVRYCRSGQMRSNQERERCLLGAL